MQRGIFSGEKTAYIKNNEKVLFFKIYSTSTASVKSCNSGEEPHASVLLYNFKVKWRPKQLSVLSFVLFRIKQAQYAQGPQEVVVCGESAASECDIACFPSNMLHFFSLLVFQLLYQVKVKLDTARAVEVYAEVEVQFHLLVTSALGYP